MAAPVNPQTSSYLGQYWRRVMRYLPIESGNYPYVTARVRAKKAALLSPDVYERMLQMEIPQIARVIGEGAYKAEVLALASRASGVDLIELATSRNLAAVFTQIIGFSEGELRQMIGWYLDRFDVQNIKTIVRGKTFGAPRGRYCEAQGPAPALGLEGDSPVRPVHRGRPGNSEGRVGRNDSDGPERTDRPAAGLRPHRGLVLPPEGLASARGWSARSLGRKAPPARGGALRARPPAVRPANPRLHRAEGAGGPEPSNHRRS